MASMNSFRTPNAFANEDAGRLSARHRRDLIDGDMKQQAAYEGLESARLAMGVSRIVIGLHLATLQDTNGWQGRSGAKSFRRFLIEEGMEPTAAYQYMIVARAFLLDHAVAPERIAMVSMRVLVIASRYLCMEDESKGIESNVDEIVSIVKSMPSAEALQSLQDRFELNEAATTSLDRPKLSRPVVSILNSVEGLTHDGRAELYQALRFKPDVLVNEISKVKLIRIPAVIRPDVPFFTEYPEGFTQ